jgi:hypothetical protein
MRPFFANGEPSYSITLASAARAAKRRFHTTQFVVQ